MNVALPPELERFVNNEVDSGRFGSSDEVILEGLRLLAERQQLQGLVEEFNAKIVEAEADFAAGRVVPGSEVRDRLRKQRERLALELAARKA